jgi:uncharacterized protein (DUF2141 family)
MLRLYFYRCILSGILLIFVSESSYSQSNETGKGTISITIINIKNSTGQINANLFNGKDGFPANYKVAYRILRIKAKEGDYSLIEFNDLNYGEYAIAIIHDEDQNNEMKTGLFGIPLEGFGFSNNVMGKFGPPEYSEATIKLNKKKLAINIMMNY